MAVAWSRRGTGRPRMRWTFATVAGEVFARYEACFAELAPYREVIAREPSAFREQIAATLSS
jgi:hypothetical protein